MNGGAPVAFTTATLRVSAPRARVTASLLLGLWLAGAVSAQPGAPDPTEPRPLRVATVRIPGRVVERSIDTDGRLTAWVEAVAQAPISGTVLRLHANLGDVVRQGQPLAELERRESDSATEQLTGDLTETRGRLARAEAAVNTSRAELSRVRDSRRTLVTEVERTRADAETRRRELERAQALRAQDLIATRDVDQARARADAAEALVQASETALGQHGDQLRAAEVQLQTELDAVAADEALVRQRETAVALAPPRRGPTVLVSPLAGIIASSDVTVGALVADGAPLFTVVAPDPLKYVGLIPERAAADLRPGQAVRLTVDSAGDRVFPGEVTHVAPLVDASAGTRSLEARVLNGEGLLRPGLAARGTVLLGQDTGVPFIPAEALLRVAGTTQVFIVAEGRARARVVQTGRQESGWVEILDGARSGEIVVTSGLAQLYDGASVAPAGPASTASP
jgi:multidrug efflux pump subunit AcrA (membrane-fusion protein)